MIRLDRITELAEFGGFEKSSAWHAGVAWIMMDAYTEQAIQHFMKALDLEPDLWVAMEGLSRCYGDSLYKQQEAILWMEKALDALPESYQWLANLFWPRISRWKMEIGDIDGAIEAAKTEYELNTGNFASIVKYLQMLHRGRRAEPVIGVIQEASSRESSNFTKSLLIQLISYGWEITEYVGLAAKTVGSNETFDIMRDAIDDAVIAADMDTAGRWCSILVRLYGAAFNYRYLDRIDVAMVFWEAALQMIATYYNDPVSWDCVSQRSECSAHLAEIYYNKALAAKGRGEDYRVWAEKLRSLAELSNSLQGDGEYDKDYSTGYASRLYGIWLRDHEQAEESEWKDCFRASILKGIELLNDEDPDNDQWGYTSLGLFLLQAGDLDSGRSAMYLTIKPKEAYQPVSKANGEIETDKVIMESSDGKRQSAAKCYFQRLSDAAEPKPEEVVSSLPRLSSFADTMWGCDGPCTTAEEDLSELHFCRICNDVCFCEACIHLINENKLPFRRCDPSHERIQIYPVPKDAGELPAATIRDGYVTPRQDWLEGLRQQWSK